MHSIHLAITGLGNVGRRLLELIELKRDRLQSQWNLELVVSGVCDTSGALINQQGLNLPDLINVKRNKQHVAWLPGSIRKMAIPDFVESVTANILVELTLTNLKDGEPGIGAIRRAFGRGMHVVTANKGPLVVGYQELSQLANANRLRLLHSAAVTGGLPTLNLGMRDLAAAGIEMVEGVFNGTTNYILSRMSEGQTFDEALQYAQEIGMAEADPSLDVDGWDAACKLVIVANAVLGRPTSLSDVAVEGIRGVTPDQLHLASSQNQVIKLIARAQRKSGDYELTVRPTSLERSHPLANVGANMMAVLYRTDINGEIFASIVEPDPYPTAAAVLRDIIHVALQR